MGPTHYWCKDLCLNVRLLKIMQSLNFHLSLLLSAWMHCYDTHDYFLALSCRTRVLGSRLIRAANSAKTSELHDDKNAGPVAVKMISVLPPGETVCIFDVHLANRRIRTVWPNVSSALHVADGQTSNVESLPPMSHSPSMSRTTYRIQVALLLKRGRVVLRVCQ